MPTVLKYLRDHGTPFMGQRDSVKTGATKELGAPAIATTVAPHDKDAPRRSKAGGPLNARFTFLPYVDSTTQETAAHVQAYLYMMREPMVKASVLSKTLAVAALDLNVTPDDPENKREQEAADFVKWALQNVGMGVQGQTIGVPGLVENITIPKLIQGFVTANKVTRPVTCGRWSGKYTLAECIAKPENTYTAELDEYGKVVNIKGMVYNTGEDFDPSLFVISRYMPLWANPRGMSDFRAAYRCYDDQTEVLTEDGWKLFAELTDDDLVAALDTTKGDGELVFQKPSDRYSYHHKGKMFCQKGRSIDLRVTPNHRMYVGKRGTRKFSVMEASEVMKGTPQVRYKRNADWNGQEQETFTLPAVTFTQKNANQFGTHSERSTTIPEKQLPMDDWLRFLGIWLSDGHSYREKGGNSQCAVGITQNLGTKFDEIEDVVKRLGFTYCVKHPRETKTAAEIEISNLQLWTYMSKLGKSRTKYVPKDIKALSSRQLGILIEWMMKGDGRHDGTQYATVSKRLANDVSEIMLKAGFAPTSYREKMNDDHIWIVSANTRNIEATLVNEHQDNRSWEEYDGMVHCVTVPAGIIYVRRNGKSCWCGNCFWIKDTVWKLRAIYLEKFGTGFLVGKYTEQDQKDLLEAALMSARGATWMTVPAEAQVEAVNIAARGTADYESAIRDLDHEIAVSITGAFLQSGEGSTTGSFAMGKVHKDTAELQVWYLAENLAGDINSQIVPDLVRMNFAGIGSLPKVSFGGVNDGEMAAALTIDTGLFGMGVELSKADLRQRYRRAVPKDLADIVKQAAAPAMPPAGGPGAESPFPQDSALNFSDAELAELSEWPDAVLVKFAGWDENEHPRGDDGKFVSGGDITAAKSDPAKAEALRARVTDPGQRAKLDKAIGGESVVDKNAIQQERRTRAIAKAKISPQQFDSLQSAIRPATKADLAGETINLWHGTSAENAKSIIADGGLSKGSRGINATIDVVHASQYPEETGSDVVFLLKAKTKGLVVDPNDQVGETVKDGLFPRNRRESSATVGDHELIASFDLRPALKHPGNADKAIKALNAGRLSEAILLGAKPTIFGNDGVAKFSDDIALTGKPGHQAAALLDAAQAHGTATLARLCKSAVKRLLALPSPKAAVRLFNDAELQELADALAATNATAHLLGQARIRALVAKRRGEPLKFGEWEESKHPRAEDGKFGSGSGATKADVAESHQRILAKVKEHSQKPNVNMKESQHIGQVKDFYPSHGNLPKAVADAHVFYDPQVEHKADAAGLAVNHNHIRLSGKAFGGGGSSGSLGDTFVHEVEHLVDHHQGLSSSEFTPRLRQMVRELDDEKTATSLLGKHGRDHAEFMVDGFFSKHTGHDLTDEERSHAVNQLINKAKAISGQTGKFADVPAKPTRQLIIPLPPEEALTYFKRLVPGITGDPGTFGPYMERQAFTMAVSTDAVVLDRVRSVIATALETGAGGVPEINAVLDDAGISVKNPQYAEMTFRTNAIQAMNGGAWKEFQDPDVSGYFTHWRYDGIPDGRARESHRVHFGKVFPNTVTFESVRDQVAGQFDGFNCRCTFTPLTREEADAQG